MAVVQEMHARTVFAPTQFFRSQTHLGAPLLAVESLNQLGALVGVDTAVDAQHLAARAAARPMKLLL